MKREYDYKGGQFRHITTKIYNIKKIALNFLTDSHGVKVRPPKRCGITGRKIYPDDAIALLFTDKGNVTALNKEAEKFMDADVTVYDWQKEEMIKEGSHVSD